MCTIEDIQYVEDVTLFFTVDEDGYSQDQADHTEGDFKYYQCTNCGETTDDEDMDDARQSVMRHVKENADE